MNAATRVRNTSPAFPYVGLMRLCVLTPPWSQEVCLGGPHQNSGGDLPVTRLRDVGVEEGACLFAPTLLPRNA